jgi:hypothetical protein
LAELHGRGVEVTFGRVSTGLRADMDRHRITEAVGADRLFRTLHEAIALARGGRGDAGVDAVPAPRP